MALLLYGLHRGLPVCSETGSSIVIESANWLRAPPAHRSPHSVYKLLTCGAILRLVKLAQLDAIVVEHDSVNPYVIAGAEIIESVYVGLARVVGKRDDERSVIAACQLKRAVCPVDVTSRSLELLNVGVRPRSWGRRHGLVDLNQVCVVSAVVTVVVRDSCRH